MLKLQNGGAANFDNNVILNWQYNDYNVFYACPFSMHDFPFMHNYLVGSRTTLDGTFYKLTYR